MRTLWTIVVAAALVGCGGDAFEQSEAFPGGSAGQAGTGGATGGTGGAAGESGSGGIAGSSGEAGSSGAVGGSGGIAGQAGSAGSGAGGGSAGTAGSGASGGSAGQAGTGGAAGGDPDGDVMATNLDNPFGITVDEDRVFWTTSDGKVLTVSLNGGSESTIATGQNMPRDIIEDGPVIYWVNMAGGNIQVMNKNGTGINTVGVGSYPIGLTQNSTHVFWANAMGMPIQYIQKGGSSVENLPAAGGFPNNLAAEDEHVYWTSGSMVRHYDLFGSTDYIVSSTETDPGAITFDDTWIYWVDRGTGYDSSVDKCTAVTGTIKAARKSNYTDVKTIATDQACPMALLADGGTLYWVNNGTYDGTVYQDNGAIMEEYGAGPQVVADNQHRPYSMDVNSDTIVWTSTGLYPDQGTVRKIAR